jgi:uncharacterized cupin superfamily protein
MKVISKHNAIHVTKPEGISVDYFLFPGYEVMYNEQVPGTTQTWHYHEHIWETLYLIDGELTAQWEQDGTHHEVVMQAGDLAESEDSPHTFINSGSTVARFIIIKQVLSGQDNSQLFKTDKVTT